VISDRHRAGSVPDELQAAVADLDPPFGVLDAAALRANIADLRRRANGKPIRVASKSVRMRSAVALVLREPGFAGVLCYALPEAIWLARTGFRDLVVGYPTVHRESIREVAGDDALAAAITLMVDDPAQLDLIDAVVPWPGRCRIRVCLELDAAFRPAGRAVTLGARRSPIRTPGDATTLARHIVQRPGFDLVGLMAYEGQIAGVGNAGHGPRAAAVRAMQHRSAAELAERRPAVVQAVRQLADLEFVNGGGTGSIESTTRDPSVTEIAAGSGLLGPGLFDHYTTFRPAPAAYFVLPVVRRPARNIVTVAGGGWIASGPPGPDRLPVPTHPAGLRYLGTESAGEVQTPLRGRAARTLTIGDRVWFRHAKSGEVCEHLTELLVVDGGRIVNRFDTYRGEGKAF
jgi:D-serine deaminase-like pyridoxal phosphate-dependent protein